MVKDATRQRYDNLSSSTEDYLREMWLMQESGEQITTHALAYRMHVSAPSVTQKVHYLASLGLVSCTPYDHPFLTRAGLNAGSDVMQRYELARLFLTTILGYSAELADDEADRLEHALSPKLRSRIVSLLQTPTLGTETTQITSVTPAWPSSASHQTDGPHSGPG